MVEIFNFEIIYTNFVVVSTTITFGKNYILSTIAAEIEFQSF